VFENTLRGHVLSKTALSSYQKGKRKKF